MSNDRIVGIDLGTTQSLIALLDSGIPVVAADQEGKRLLPSVVRFTGLDDNPEVGAAAKRGRMVHPEETVSSVKRFMGRRYHEIVDSPSSVSFPLSSGKQGEIVIPLHGQNHRPEDVSAEILKKLKKTAEEFFEEELCRAVITVPAYFNDAQRKATKTAGEKAGFIVERILNEPTAAALAYGTDQLGECAKIAVYDLGGGTFDLSILELNNGVFQVLSTHGNTRLGGDDIDQAVCGFLRGEILKQGGPDIDADASQAARIRDVAEETKIKLSEKPSHSIQLPFLNKDFSFSFEFNREQLETLSRDLIRQTRGDCIQALADAKLKSTDLDQVILVGGQTRMPLVRRLVSEWFGCRDFDEIQGSLSFRESTSSDSGPMLNTSQSPEEAVVLGAAVQAGILSGNIRNLTLLDITPLSLGIETFGGLMNVIIPRNTTIPTKAGELFTTAVDGQEKMMIHILQGEREKAIDNWSLGKFTLEFKAAAKRIPRIGVQFEIDSNGILHVLARDTATQLEKTIQVESAVDVEDSKVQQMVEESVEHAFEDWAVRKWVEARQRALETVHAAREGLEMNAEELDSDYRSQLLRSVQFVQEALQTEDSETGAGDLELLKKAHLELDEVSRELADLIMDKAMESILSKKGLI
ncbi:MAG TPA: molecular chaperone DnaK [Verrucomicrobiales bacterium]|jgi:molecular chaperone DnaK|nr:molecular chaperone DnaK [Verrucomicrobiales bacterium]HIL70111.1 molecular chaperone DnaK [Verrucomicrobiota bacterium]